MSYFNRKKSGELTSVMMNDVNLMQDAFTTTFQKILVEPINILFFGTYLFIIDWKLSLLALLILPIAGLLYVGVGVSVGCRCLNLCDGGVRGAWDTTLGLGH